MFKTIFLRPIFSVGAIALATMPTVSLAQEAPKEPKLVVEIKALTDTFEGLRDKSADSVASGGGEMESAILSAYAIKAAAEEIVKDAKIVVDAKAEGKPYLIVGQGDAIASDVYAAYQAEYQAICTKLSGSANCIPALPGKGGGNIVALAGAILPLLSSLTRSETEISKLPDGLMSDTLLAYAVAKKIGVTATVLVPPSLVKIADGDATINELETLRTRNKASRSLKKPSKDQKAAVAAADAFLTALFTADSNGKVKLIDVIRTRQIADARASKTLMRVHIEKSGGSLLKRKNLLVAFGAPSVAVTGGLIASYVIDAGNGTASGQGMVVCTTKLANLRTVHKLRKDNEAANCEPF